MKCTRKFEFDAGHRIVGHKYKCKYVHGHRFSLELTLESKELNQLGMVIDFGVVKSLVNTWIEDNLDHTLILNKSDKTLGQYISEYTGQKIYYLDQNPTAENIALHIKMDILPQLFDSNAFNFKVKVSETPNCSAEV